MGFVPHKGTSSLSREGSGAGVGSSNSPLQPQEDLTRMSGSVNDDDDDGDDDDSGGGGGGGGGGGLLQQSATTAGGLDADVWVS